MSSRRDLVAQLKKTTLHLSSIRRALSGMLSDPTDMLSFSNTASGIPLRFAAHTIGTVE